MVDEQRGCMTSVSLQTHREHLRPVAYFSAKLDPVTAGLSWCLCAVAAAEKALFASHDLVGYSDVTFIVPNMLSQILQDQKNSHLSAARLVHYHTRLLDMPNVTIRHCSALNPASLLPLPDDGEEHCCIAALQQQSTPHSDLSDTPLSDPDLIFYVDGSAFRHKLSGVNKVVFAVVSDVATVRSGSLPSHYSAQAAELIALT